MKPKCRVKVNGRLSDELIMERGVLQGSVCINGQEVSCGKILN